jgi:cephalosporin hydroxylase
VAADHRGSLAYHRNDRDIGGTANIFRSVELAAGEYCWVVGSDDGLEPRALEAVLSTLQANDGVTGVSFDFRVYGPDMTPAAFGYPREIYPDGWSRPARYRTSGAIQHNLGLLFGYLSNHVVHRQAWIDALRRQPPAERSYPLFGMLLHLGRIAHGRPDWVWIPKTLVQNRSGNQSWTTAELAWRYHLRASREVRTVWSELPGRDSDEFTALDWRWYHLCGNPQVMIDCKLQPGGGPKRDLAMLAGFTRVFWRRPEFWRWTLPALLTPVETLRGDQQLIDRRTRKWRQRPVPAAAPAAPQSASLSDQVRAPGLNRLLLRPKVRDAIAGMFDRAYFYAFPRTLFDSRWLGTQLLKYPTDLFVYQELLAELRPALIIETGTWRGGSAVFLATVCDAIGHGNVVSIDVAAEAPLPEHPRVTYLSESSVDSAVRDRVMAEHAGVDPVLVILDSDHGKDHVLAELRLWSEVVTPGSYLVVEDTNLNGHPVAPTWGPGPMEAVLEFLGENPEFSPDPVRQRLMLSANPRGFLRRR